MATKVTTKLAHLPGEVTIDSCVEHAHALELFVSIPKTQDLCCPYCGSDHLHVKDYSSQLTVRHVPLGNKGTMITFRKCRYFCNDCRKSFYDTPYWICEDQHLTQMLRTRLLEELQTLHSLTDIAKSTFTTEHIVTDFLDKVEAPAPARLPQTLCIDEFKGSSGEWDPEIKRWQVNKFHTNNCNGDNGTVVDILPEINKEYLVKYFSVFPKEEKERVRYFCCDMHGGFISLAKDCFPNARICADMFHVIRLITEALTDIRIEVQKKLQCDGDNNSYELVKHSQHLLVTSHLNYKLYWKEKYEAKSERLKTILAFSDNLATAHQALQEFYDILSEKSFNVQRLMLTDWLETYLNCGVYEVEHAAKTIRHYRGYIHNSLEYKKSNGPCEGLNQKIKCLKRSGFGSHSFEHFRKRILLSCGTTSFIRDTYSLIEEKAR